MERGTYVAASGGLVQLRKLDIINNNLANVSTPGFKRQMLVDNPQSFDQTFASLLAAEDPFARGDHERTPAAVNLQSVTDFSPGPIRSTGNPLDVALRNPKDFFVINGPNGPLYTRAGDFTLDREGTLVTMDGFPVQGDGGAISANGATVKIASDGEVLANGQTVARLQVVRIEDPRRLERVGATRFTLPRGAEAPEQVSPELEAESLEMSNVSAMVGVIEMIAAQRGFQLYTKSAETIDQMNTNAITRLGGTR